MEIRDLFFKVQNNDILLRHAFNNDNNQVQSKLGKQYGVVLWGVNECVLKITLTRAV